MRLRALMLLALPPLAACGPSPTIGLLESHAGRDSRASFVVCAEYQCTRRYDVLLTDAEWARVRALFAPPAADAAAERARIALAVGQIERLVGPKTNTDRDRPGGAHPDADLHAPRGARDAPPRP